ncbi:MAG TPA: hypothetical protein VF155_11315 [Candidatus Dormibacteraeota bacterium]
MPARASMGFWQRARLVLKGDIGPRVAGVQHSQPEEELSGPQLAALEEIAARMATMAEALKELDARAQMLNRSPEGTEPAERAQVQVAIIDELLDGVHQLRTALDAQSVELAEAERRLTGGDNTLTA